MPGIRLGQVEYINCIPVYHALEEGLLVSDIELVKGPPSHLNKMFLKGELDITPISSIEYARHADQCIILPNLSISADGRVESILLFSHLQPTELEGKTIAVTTSSATSVVLLRILFEHFYHVDVELISAAPDLNTMLSTANGALLIGDDAMQAHQQVLSDHRKLIVTDLGEAWKEFTGQKMVYAVWVAHTALARTAPHVIEQMAGLLYEAKQTGWSQRKALIDKARQRSGLPFEVVHKYLDTIHHELGEEEQKALLTYFDYAYKSGIIEERVKLNIF